MSSAQTQNTQKDNNVDGGCLDALGLSQRELVLAEALQMEYDMLSRHKQDKAQTGSRTPTIPPPGRLSPTPGQSCSSASSTEGVLSGSEPALNQLADSQIPPPIPSRTKAPQSHFTKEPLYILKGPVVSKVSDPSGPGQSDLNGSGSGILSKDLSSPPDDIPPAIPPRNPIHLPSGSVNLSVSPLGSASSRDVNLFTPDTDQPKMMAGELDYGITSNSPTLGGGRPRSRRSFGAQTGKPVARSKTLPPQVPPRPHLSVVKSNKNQRRVSAGQVSLGSRINGFGYELFQVSEERDEEVAAFCHMLDVLRSAYPWSDRSKNSGFIWSPSVGQEELHQGLGISVKVSVICEHFREPLTFTCDGSSTVDLLIYQTFCYAHQDLDHLDVDHYLLKVLGQDEYFNK